MPKWMLVILWGIPVALLLIFFWTKFVDGLTSPSWQGIAGIAQVAAAIFTFFTIIQARNMQKQAERERRESAAPNWGIVDHKKYSETQDYKHESTFILFIKNIGFGAARNVQIEYKPSVDGISAYLQGFNISRAVDTVSPNDIIEVKFVILGEPDKGRNFKELKDSFNLTCLSLYGDRYTWLANFNTENRSYSIQPIKRDKT